MLVFLLLSFIYKPLTAAKILAPSIISSAFAIGLVNIIGEPISLFHILAVFLIIGFGLDYSVFRAGGVKNSSDAVLLSCATTVFSFLLLACTSFKLISSLGFILSAGSLHLTSQVLYLTILNRRRTPDEMVSGKRTGCRRKTPLYNMAYIQNARAESCPYCCSYSNIFRILGAKEARRCSKKYLEIIELKPSLYNQFRHFLEYSFSLVDNMEVFSGNYDTGRIIFNSGQDKIYFDEIISHGAFLIFSHLGNINVLRALVNKYNLRLTFL